MARVGSARRLQLLSRNRKPKQLSEFRAEVNKSRLKTLRKRSHKARKLTWGGC